MSDRHSLGQDTELRQIPGNHNSTDPLIQSDSGKDLESGSGTDRKSHSNDGTQKKRSIFKFRRHNARFEGWKFTIFLAFIASLIVLFFNVGFVLYSTTHRWQTKHRNTILYEGDCAKVHRLSIGFHLLINSLSTALLGASNFGMQCLVAPTRRSIDQAHKSGQWLDIGVPSVRNLFRTSYGRSLLWLCLACSSLPFHLVYNSAVYATTAASAYDIYAGPGSLAQKSLEELVIDYGYYTSTPDSSFKELYGAAKSGNLDRLDNYHCLNAFAQTYQTTYEKLWVVSDSTKGNNTYALIYTNPVFSPSGYGYGDLGPYDWICPSSAEYNCNSKALSAVRTDISQNAWTVGSPGGRERFNVQYCMAMKKAQHCKLQYSFPLTMVVIVFNLIKASVLLYMWLGIPEAPILTIGDAIASFLRRSDSYTRNGCLLSGAEVRHMDRATSATLKKKPLRAPKIFDDKRRRWGSAASGRRWTFSVALWLLAILVCIALLKYGIDEISARGSNLNAWTIQLGTANANTLINGTKWPTTLLANVIIANLPQLIFSCLYFAFNSLLTSMCLAAEWSGYANNRKSLRVSNNPQLSQRSNYFLSIPYRYALPLIVLSVTLHWLISESLFVVGIEAWDMNMMREPDSDLTTCGYSPVAILSSICVGALMFICLVGLSFQPLESAMPVAGSCSMAIAAACHPLFDPNRHEDGGGGDVDSENEDEDMGLLPVQWGAVPVDGPMGHCSFTSGDVEMPQRGREYQ
ncbi:hypothetical protein N7513_003933 [Penicillium frequentans]|nr:hypothetical protein N7513_003933 [Penicillium glabrum]